MGLSAYVNAANPYHSGASVRVYGDGHLCLLGCAVFIWLLSHGLLPPPCASLVSSWLHPLSDRYGKQNLQQLKRVSFLVAIFFCVCVFCSLYAILIWNYWFICREVLYPFPSLSSLWPGCYVRHCLPMSCLTAIKTRLWHGAAKNIALNGVDWWMNLKYNHKRQSQWYNKPCGSFVCVAGVN